MKEAFIMYVSKSSNLYSLYRKCLLANKPYLYNQIISLNDSFDEYISICIIIQKIKIYLVFSSLNEFDKD